jgi:UDP-glucose 4-epimerase
MGNGDSVLVVGGGFIGTAAARALAAHGRRVNVLTRAPAPVDLSTVEWSYGDLQSSRLEALIEGKGAIVCARGTITPATEVETLSAALTDELIPVVRLAETAARLSVPHFVFTSSGGTVYGEAQPVPTTELACPAPINTYGVLKSQTEQALLEVARRTGITVIILRVANPYGPGQVGTRQLGFVGAAVRAAVSGSKLTIWGDGSVTRDFVFIDDVGRAFASAVEFNGPSTIINIGSGNGTSLRQVCTIIEKVTGRSLELELSEARAVDVRRSTLDVTRARTLLRWQPTVSLEEGIALTAGRIG